MFEKLRRLLSKERATESVESLRSDSSKEGFLTSEGSGRERARVRRLRMGVDFGTSQSKLVFADYSAPDGVKAIVVRPGGTPRSDYRIPSTVAFDGQRFLFGRSAEESADSRHNIHIYRSLKMLAAYPDDYFGEKVNLPEFFTAADLATLFVGHLISLGREAMNTYCEQLKSEPQYGVTMGVPMSDLDDSERALLFVRMIREAFEIAKSADLSSAIDVGSARTVLKEAREKTRSHELAEPRDWVRSEAEAALFWAYQSPNIAPGMYASVDVGAGTTSASWFKINSSVSDSVTVKTTLSFFGAACAPPGCDALDDVLYRHAEGESRAAIRGQENTMIEHLTGQTRSEIGDVLVRIADVLSEASTIAFEKYKSQKAWRGIGRIFLLGGGATISTVRDSLCFRKKDWLAEDPIAEPGVPLDLYDADGKPYRGNVRFMLVAYGLARRLADVPDIYRPSEIDEFTPYTTSKPRPHHEDIYTESSALYVRRCWLLRRV